MAALIEVVLIVHRMAQDTSQRPLAQTGTGTLRRVNDELEEWERSYLGNSGMYHSRQLVVAEPSWDRLKKR